jgi:hypothetical protein
VATQTEAPPALGLFAIITITAIIVAAALAKRRAAVLHYALRVSVECGPVRSEVESAGCCQVRTLLPRESPGSTTGVDSGLLVLPDSVSLPLALQEQVAAIIAVAEAPTAVIAALNF